VGSVKAILRKAYIEKLNGITVSGITIPAYDLFAADNAPANYIVLSSYNSVDLTTKCGDDENPSVEVQVYTKFQKQGGSLLADQIAEMVIDLIKANDMDLSPNYKLLSTRKSSDSDLPGLNSDYKIYRRIIRFEHIVQDLNK